MEAANGRRRSAAALAFGCAIASTAYLLVLVDAQAGIAEDAAILMRYAWHLGLGLGYVWNPGEPPVDGATDWLGTTVLGGLYALDVPLTIGPRMLGGASHVLTIALVVVILRCALNAPVSATLASAAILIAGPARAYVQAAFLTSLFAFVVLIGWSCVVFAATGGSSLWAYGFAVAMLAATLVRPEGLVFVVLMIAGASFLFERSMLRRFVLATALLFMPLFVAFVVWRWHYFGRLLPLPFLKKGGGGLHWDGLVDSVTGAVVLLWWSLPLIALGLRPDGSRRWVAAMAIVCGGFVGVWVLVSSEMNYLWRFQYAVVPIVAASWWAAARATWNELGSAIRRTTNVSRLTWYGALVIVTMIVIAAQYVRFRPGFTEDGLRSTGELMHRLAGSDRRLVTTEAGLLPLYSEWRTVDAWGLNDARVVNDGGITDEYLSSIDADVIMFHAYYTPLTETRPSAGAWETMVATLHTFAACHGYRLAAAFAPELTQAHYYFVKASWPGADRFTSDLRAAPYGWATTRARDLSGFERRPSCGSPPSK